MKAYFPMYKSYEILTIIFIVSNKNHDIWTKFCSYSLFGTWLKAAGSSIPEHRAKAKIASELQIRDASLSLEKATLIAR